MFPLGTVLVPTGVLPLHVFEPRYRALVERCLAGEPEFGVVLIERGSEVGGGDVRFEVGTVARIVEAARYDDGRFALVTVGAQRVRVERWLDDDPYPRAVVTPVPDAPAGPGDVRRRDAVEASLRRVLALASELGAAMPAGLDLPADPVAAGWRAAALAPLGPLDALALLQVDEPAARLDRLVAMLDDLAELLTLRLES
ncbi:MAG: hypothetical protein FJW88_00640 [Actinobacteria bacterium]|nr:hypothetical protein [Actinomycetota bacterium]